MGIYHGKAQTFVNCYIFVRNEHLSYLSKRDRFTLLLVLLKLRNYQRISKCPKAYLRGNIPVISLIAHSAIFFSDLQIIVKLSKYRN